MGGADWIKGYTMWHTTDPNTTRMNEKVLARSRTEVGIFAYHVLFLIVLVEGSLWEMLQG